MKLCIRSGPETGKTVEFGDRLVIGREADCDLILKDPKVSRRHATIAVTPDGDITLQDLGSTNGTFVDGSRVAGSQRVTGASEIRIGDTTVAVLVPQAAPPTVVDAPPDEGSPRTVGDEIAPRHRERPALETVSDQAPITGAQLVAGSGSAGATPMRPTVADPMPPQGETLVDRGPAGGAATISDASTGAGTPTIVDLDMPAGTGATVADAPAERGSADGPSAPRDGRKGIVIGGAALASVAFAVIIVAALTRNGSSEAIPSRSTPTTVPIEAPIALTPATTDWTVDPSSWTVVLTWEAPAGVVDHYVVSRDGKTLAGAVEDTSFTDDKVEPGHTYHYRVAAVGATGRAAARQRVRTPKFAPSLARLQGRFSMDMVVVSSTVGHESSCCMTWVFDPHCSIGPCDVGWTVRQYRTEGSLQQQGGLYAAELSTPFRILSCDSTVRDEEVTVRLRITAASVVGGAWRATKVVGELSESAPGYSTSSVNCLSASADWTYTGSIVT